jgi:hypothetical protein
LDLRIWVATFIVGTVNDYIFMLLPVVDNFWQAGKLEAIGGNSMAVLATAFATTHTK